MSSINRKRSFFLFITFLLLATGFVGMKLDPVAHGFGILSLNIAPILIVLGFLFGIVSIFVGKKINVSGKGQLVSILLGWGVFLVSISVYITTLEDTASLWDCSEFIACIYKLQVPHPPGAPLFMLIGKIFSFLSFGKVSEVAYWINFSSAFFSALAAMFTFWIIVMLGKKIGSEHSKLGLMIAGVVGSLSLAFSDSFWFSAVEAETYAMAIFFITLTFWAILKWEQIEATASADGWLIFIIYTLGLSVGVHPMALLILPAISVIVAFRSHAFSWKRLSYALLAGSLGILFLNHVVLFGLPDLLKTIDIFFVNYLSLPFYSGAAIGVLTLVLLGVWGYRWCIIKTHKNLAIMIVGLMYFVIGYSSYFIIIIRSQADPSVDEHNPENLISLTSYLKRESYGSNPFLYGPTFESKIKGYDKGAPVYAMGDKKYEIKDHKTSYEYDKDDKVLFPRMHSRQPNHIETYKKWTGLADGEKPRVIDNIDFMIKYQFGHMYFRYLMFNFSGRANDIQHADWLGPLDIFSEIPVSLKKNKARNNFLMLPFLLGLLGAWYHYKSDKTRFYGLLTCFLFLGLILVFYLNSSPNEPRERDYIYVGSYFAFSIWIGIGSLTIFDLIEQGTKKVSWLVFVCLLSIIVPFSLLYIGFDDHNRSGRTLQVDHARNTLASCQPNAILFTGGDNDTFPLWYVQEVENFRTDVRVIVLSYFNGDWYIDQMQRTMYESKPLPFSLQSAHYNQGGLIDILPYAEKSSIKGAINLQRYLDLVRDENKSIQVHMSDDTKYNSIPSRTFFMPIDYDSATKIVPKEFWTQIPKNLNITWQGRFMEKSTFMALDLIASNQWKRPIYFNNTSLNNIGLDLAKSTLKEGQVYRLLPIQLDQERQINVDLMYDNMMDNWQFRDLGNEEVYYNHEDYQLRILQNIKSAYNELAVGLLEQGDTSKADKVLSFICQNLISENIEIDATLVHTVDLLFAVGKYPEGLQLSEQLFNKADEEMQYYIHVEEQETLAAKIQLMTLRQLHEIGVRHNQIALSDKCLAMFQEYYGQSVRTSF